MTRREAAPRPSVTPPGARVRAALLLLFAASLLGCGTGVHEHALEVAVSDPSGRLGPPPHEVSVFDGRMGHSAEWAERTMGTAAPGAPFRTTFSTVDTVTVGVARPAKVDLWLYLPGLDRRGFFFLHLEPAARPEGEAALAFSPFGDSRPAGELPGLTARWSTAPAPKGWRIGLRIEVPPVPQRAPAGTAALELRTTKTAPSNF